MPYCLVPMCNNTSRNAQYKKFFVLPGQRKRRNDWLKAIRRLPTDISENAVAWVCEDHFQLETDLENFVRYKFYDSNYCKLKPGVVPHICDCQKDRLTATPQHLPTKRRKTDYLEEIEYEQVAQVPDLEIECAGALCSLQMAPCALVPPLFTEDSGRTTMETKATQCYLCCSNIGLIAEKLSSSPSTIAQSSPSSFTVTNSSGSWRISEESGNDELNKQGLECNLKLIKNKPLAYIGVRNECMHIIDILRKKLKCNEVPIFIVLMKIRKNYSFSDIGDKFGLSVSQVSRIFSNYVGRIENLLMDFVFWPLSSIIQENLPLSFRANYKNVESILDCLEIEIEQPTDPILQTITWSYYKKCNTMKYLVSATPNGFINFISKGYGGRTSDLEVFKRCGILNIIPQGVRVMSDRGFKGIATHLERIGCRLIKPPSFIAGQTLSREEANINKQIASLRIHIERVTRRLREFKLLMPNSCVNLNLVKYLDPCVKIASCLSNMQPSINC